MNSYNQPNYQQNYQPMNQMQFNQMYPPQDQTNRNLFPSNNQFPPNYGQPISQQPFQPMQQQPYPHQQNNPVQGNAIPMVLIPKDDYEINECFGDLNQASEAFVINRFEGRFVRDIFYDISIKYRNGGVNRNIFIGKKAMRNIFNKDAFKVQIKYIPINEDYNTFIKNKDYEERFMDVATDKNATKPIVKITHFETNTCYGDIRQPVGCCCSDPDFQIRNQSSDIKYRISTIGSQCAYCCCAGCCCSNSPINFQIYDSQSRQIVGEILKGEIINQKELANYRIIFPVNASPEDKILLISSAITIDVFNYNP